MQDFVDRNSVALSVDAGLSYSNCCFQPNRLSTPLGTRKASSSLLLSIPTAMDLHGGKLLVDREHRSKQCRGNRGERVWEEELTYYAEFALRQSHKDTFNRSQDHPNFLFSKMQVAGNHRKGGGSQSNSCRANGLSARLLRTYRDREAYSEASLD